MQPSPVGIHKFFKALGTLTGISFISACGTAMVTDPAAKNYLPTPGTIVSVPQRIEVPGGQTRIFFQRGEIVKKLSDIDQYKANCNFEINTLAETPRYIEPGVYTITRTTQQLKEVAEFKPLQYASLAIGGSIAISGEGAPLYFSEVLMVLRSEKPSDIRNLACRGVFNDPAWVEPPTLADIRETMGKHASITVPEEKTK
ncbi:MAG: hypothetical protein R3240_06040 [Gammaproteobacteria bacterium]|nr:hypothetical protein [Gammaproteobacteria bacterium]